MSQNEKIEVGDTVKLKSGGPLMTVGDIRDGGRVVCYFWIEKTPDGKTMIQEFPIATLKKDSK